jgi:hypothetical protein
VGWAWLRLNGRKGVGQRLGGVGRGRVLMRGAGIIIIIIIIIPLTFSSSCMLSSTVSYGLSRSTKP